MAEEEGRSSFSLFGDDQNDTTAALTETTVNEDEPELSWSSSNPEDNLSDWTIEIIQQSSSSKNEDDSAASQEQQQQQQLYFVHKCFLAVGPRRSLYFVKMFQTKAMKEHQNSRCTIVLEEDAAKVFPTFLDYIYGKHNHHHHHTPLDAPSSSCSSSSSWISTSTAVPLHSLASYFGVPSLSRIVDQFWTTDLTYQTGPLYAAAAIGHDSHRILQAAIHTCALHFSQLDDDDLANVTPETFQRIATEGNERRRGRRSGKRRKTKEEEEQEEEDPSLLSRKVAAYCKRRRKLQEMDNEEEKKHGPNHDSSSPFQTPFSAVSRHFLTTLTHPSRMVAIDPSSAACLLREALDHFPNDDDDDNNDNVDNTSLLRRCHKVLTRHWRTTVTWPSDDSNDNDSPPPSDFASLLPPATQLSILRSVLPLAREEAARADRMEHEVQRLRTELNRFQRLSNLYADAGYRIAKGDGGAQTKPPYYYNKTKEEESEIELYMKKKKEKEKG